MTALLEIEDLRILLRAGDHREIPLVDGVSLAVAPGRVVGLAGESGSGKTLTGLSTMGFFPDRSRATGAVRIAGEDVLRMKSSRLRRMRGNEVAIVFQDPMTSLHPMLTVGRQLTEHVRVHLGLSQKDADARAIELLTTVRLPDPERVLASYPHEFSGGMRQRIAIASALACDPKLLIADEPTTALDVTVQAGILRLLDRLRRERDLAVLMISHDLGVMSALADELHVLYAGRIVESGPAGELLAGAAPSVHAQPARQPAGPVGTGERAEGDSWRAAAAGAPSPGLRLRPALRLRRAAVHASRAAALPDGHRPDVSVRGRSARFDRIDVTLQLRQLSVSYQRPHRPPVHAVVGVDLEVGAGEVVGLVGESGCGKSTLARAAIGLVPRSGGDVTFLGSDVPALGSGPRPAELRRMQMIFQDPYASLNPRRRVGRQVADGFDGVRQGHGAR